MMESHSALSFDPDEAPQTKLGPRVDEPAGPPKSA
jgi:hypothetical protein